MLSEWLAEFTSTRELQTTEKKRKGGVGGARHCPATCLVTCLRHVVEQVTLADSLDGGDVRHRAVLGQIMAALVEEAVTTGAREAGEMEAMVQEVLVTLARQYMDKVMDVLLLHFQPNSVKINTSIFNNFGCLASHLPFQVVPFAKTILDLSVLISKQVKASDTELKTSFCGCLVKVVEAVVDYIDHTPETSDNIVTKDQFSVNADVLYETVFVVWMGQTRDGEARAQYLLLLAALTPLLSEDTVCARGPGYLATLPALFKRSSAFYEVSLCVYQLLAVVAASEVCLLVDTTTEPLMAALFQQVCIPLDFSQPASMKNLLEILKCYDILMETCSEKIVQQMLAKERVKWVNLIIAFGFSQILHRRKNRYYLHKIDNRQILFAI